MTIADFSILFDAVLAVLLAVMIFYAVRLNQRIVLLRNRESDMQEMIAQFNESSAIAQDSAQKLRAAGTEAEFGVKAAAAKAMALRNDLEALLDQADMLVDRIDGADIAPRSPAPRHEPMPREAEPPAREVEPTPRQEQTATIRQFSPPVRSADEVIRAEAPTPGRSEDLQPRTEAEKQLLEAIRAAKEGAMS